MKSALFISHLAEQTGGEVAMGPQH